MSTSVDSLDNVLLEIDDELIRVLGVKFELGKVQWEDDELALKICLAGLFSIFPPNPQGAKELEQKRNELLQIRSSGEK